MTRDQIQQLTVLALETQDSRLLEYATSLLHELGHKKEVGEISDQDMAALGPFGKAQLAAIRSEAESLLEEKSDAVRRKAQVILDNLEWIW